MIRVAQTGKNPTMRHLGRTHGVSVKWIHQTFLSPQYVLLYEETNKQAADIFTKAFTDPAKWYHACRLIGVIAGTRSIDPVGWLMLPRPNDGRVSVARTRIPGLHGHLVLPVSHALMMNHPIVIAQTARFLATGAFAA